MAEIITLDIYEDEDFEVLKRTATAKNRKIGYGLIMKLVELMDFKGVEDLNNEEALPVVLSSYRSINKVLRRVFPDVTDDEWDCVTREDVMKAVGQIIAYMGSEVATIPTTGDPKN